MTAPRAAAIAGIVFSLLLIVSIVLIRMSVPADPRDTGAWLPGRAKTVELALNLVPFAGIAFMWFIGVLRDRLGRREDRLFATVFLGSGLLFLAMLFFTSAMVGGLILTYASDPDHVPGSLTLTFARVVVFEVMNIYAVKMAGVFMFVTSTLALRTGFLARWIACLGFVLALSLVLSSGYIAWILVVFPLWVLLVSLYILVDNLRAPSVHTQGDVPP
jgi:MFS family permease